MALRMKPEFLIMLYKAQQCPCSASPTKLILLNLRFLLLSFAMLNTAGPFQLLEHPRALSLSSLHLSVISAWMLLPCLLEQPAPSLHFGQTEYQSYQQFLSFRSTVSFCCLFLTQKLLYSLQQCCSFEGFFVFFLFWLLSGPVKHQIQEVLHVYISFLQLSQRLLSSLRFLLL